MSDTQPDSNTQDRTPADCFRLEEIDALRALEGLTLEAVHYLIWFNPDAPQQRFLAYLELLFQQEQQLLLGVDEDAEALRLVTPEQFLQHAQDLVRLNQGKPGLQQANAAGIAPWNAQIGQTLRAVRLTKTPEGLYANDALLLEFTHSATVVAVNDNGGLLVVAQAV